MTTGGQIFHICDHDEEKKTIVKSPKEVTVRQSCDFNTT